MEQLKEIKFIAIHHCQRKTDSPEEIKKRHLARGFEDIGYHYLIGKEGEFHLGRPEEFVGAHVFGHNNNSIGVCLIGDFDDEKPTEKQITALTGFLKDKMKKHNIPAGNVLGHREFPSVTKTCPGKFFDVDEIRKMLEVEKVLVNQPALFNN